MKFNSGSIVSFFAGFAAGYLICRKDSDDFLDDDKDDKKGILLTGPIHIIDFDKSDQSLSLKHTHGRDAVYVQVTTTQDIAWEVTGRKTKDVQIVNIYVDPVYAQSTNPNFFSTKPNGDGKRWTAKIGEPDLSKLFFKYIIEWKLDTDPPGITYKFDPIMQLNPK